MCCFCRRFLFGLKKYGKGDWRNISRNFVITRTPTQVASHAQKYFIRLNSGGKDKRRSSIHDITTANLPDNRPPSPSQSSDPATQTSLASTPIPSAPFSSILDSSHPNEATTILTSSVQGSTIRATKLWSDTLWSATRRSCTSEWHTRCYRGSGP